MNVVVGLVGLVALVITAGVTGAPEQQLEIQDQMEDYDEEQLEHKDLGGCGTRKACKIVGGRCQPLTEECDGKMRTNGFYCMFSKNCGCCIPKGPSGLFKETDIRDPKPSGPTHDMTAQQLVTTVSGGDLLRGFFICKDESKIMKKRWQSIEVSNKTKFNGPAMSSSYFSREFDKETSSQNFMETVNNFGKKLAVHADASYLFDSLKAGYKTNDVTKSSSKHTTNTKTTYLSSIKCYNIPIQSVILDPFHMELDQRVLDELIEIENKINKKELTEIENKINKNDSHGDLFLYFFEQYGSHYLTGLMELGGTVIVKSETFLNSSDDYEEKKSLVKKSASFYLDLSASFGEASGGGGVKTSSYGLKSHFESRHQNDSLKQVTLTIENKGGPPGEGNITIWKQKLVKQIETWRVIDKSTEMLSIWDFILMKNYTKFNNTTQFARQMKEAWEDIVEHPNLYYPLLDREGMKKLALEFEELGISLTYISERRELLGEMLDQGKVIAQKHNKSAKVSILKSGQAVLSALQEHEEQLDNDTTILQFDSLTFLPERPYKVYIRLEHNDLYLGDIIIVLNGSYPKLVQQFLELSTGDNNVGGAWRGAGFDYGIGDPGYLWEGGIGCSGYMNASGWQTDSLFPVEDTDPETAPVAGEVLGNAGQVSGFRIVTQSAPDIEVPYPVIGHVTPESLGILQAVVVRGTDFFKDITFTNCGLVVID